MKKTILSIFLTTLLLCCMMTGISADRTLPLVVDDGGLLSESEYNSLLSELERISANQRCEVAVITVDSLEGQSVVAYADDIYDYYGYGYGENDDGVLLLVAMNEREFHITTHGFAFYGLTDYGLAMIEDAFLNDLSGGRYFDAFMAYARTCDEFLTLAREGTPVDIGYDSAFNWGGALMISAVIGLIGGLIMVNSMKSSMTTVKMAVNAQNYVRQNSLHLTAQGDRFLYTQTQRIPRSDGSSGGSRGGSTGHRSSSGRTHGGRSGRF
jgi:uncharacterized protein